MGTQHTTGVWKRFIVIEGIDGAGTTTLAQRLADTPFLRERGVMHGFEPTDGPIGCTIRQGLAGSLTLSARSLALLFAADRSEHLNGPGGVRSFLNQGGYYLSDRYLFSSLAYQGLNLDPDWVAGLNRDFPLPSHLIYLTLPVDDAMNRISGRKGRDIFENHSFQFQVAESYERVIDAYEAEATGMRILRLDSQESVDVLCERALAFISN